MNASASPIVPADAAALTAVAPDLVPAPASTPVPNLLPDLAPVPSPGQPTPAGVRSGRERIDDLDARILALIAERVETARAIQAARIADGGRRLDLKRETEIIARYRAALGRPGVTVAMTVLELCRGRV